MENALIHELNKCVDICIRLERMFQQDVEDIASIVTGDVYDAYKQSVNSTREATTTLKQKIMLLRSDISLL